MYRIGEILTPEERLDAMRLGGIKKLAGYGLSPSSFSGLVKKAGVSDKIGLLGAALRTSVLIGAPIGAVWFALSNGLRHDSKNTKMMKATLDHYNDVVAENERKVGDSYAEGR